MSEQPGPGGICDTCGHFARRHDEQGCHGVDPAKGCRFGPQGEPCIVMWWQGQGWPRPWLAAPDGMTSKAEMTMTTDHTEIRNSADDDVPVLHRMPVHQCHKVSDRLHDARASNREYTRLFEESQEVARVAVEEIKRLRKFIADEFLLDAS